MWLNEQIKHGFLGQVWAMRAIMGNGHLDSVLVNDALQFHHRISCSDDPWTQRIQVINSDSKYSQKLLIKFKKKKFQKDFKKFKIEKMQ